MKDLSQCVVTKRVVEWQPKSKPKIKTSRSTLIWLTIPIGLLVWNLVSKPSGVIANYPAQVGLPASAAPTDTNQPSTIKIQVKLTSAEDLKVKRGDRISEGDVISDRSAERIQKQSEIDAIRMQITEAEKIKSASGKLPSLELPAASYVQEEQSIEQVRSEIAIQNKKIEELQSVDVPDAVNEHEQAILDKLKMRLKMANGDLEAAKTRRKYQEYEHQRNLQNSVMEHGKAEQIYGSRQSELSARLTQLESELTSIAQVRAPFSGTVRSVKWLAQTDQSLAVEIAISVDKTTATQAKRNYPLERKEETTSGITRIISIDLGTTEEAPEVEPDTGEEEQ